MEVGCLGYISPSLFHCLESLPANFEMNVVVSLTGVVTCSFSAEAVWTGLPCPWVDLSTFLKARLGSTCCSYLAVRFSPCMSFPLSQACSPMPTAATMLALCAFLFLPSGLPALPAMISLSSRSQSACAVTNFFTMRMRISLSISACAVTKFFTMLMRISPSHGCGLRLYTHAVALILIETESSCGEGCFGLCPWSDKF